MADELLLTANSIISNLQIDETAIARNLDLYGPFAATERVMMASVKAGANRQEMHALIRSHAVKAWVKINGGGNNPLIEDLCSEKGLTKYLSAQEIRHLMTVMTYIGDAPGRARRLANEIQEVIKS